MDTLLEATHGYCETESNIGGDISDVGDFELVKRP